MGVIVVMVQMGKLRPKEGEDPSKWENRAHGLCYFTSGHLPYASPVVVVVF